MLFHNFNAQSWNFRLSLDTRDLFVYLLIIYLSFIYYYFKFTYLLKFEKKTIYCDLRSTSAVQKKYPDPTKELPVLNKTILNAEVSEIDYNVPNGVIKVSTTNGFEYRAEHVIVTVSLGVLKATHEKMFNPPLPETKVNAIQVRRQFLFSLNSRITES